MITVFWSAFLYHVDHRLSARTVFVHRFDVWHFTYYLMLSIEDLIEYCKFLPVYNQLFFFFFPVLAFIRWPCADFFCVNFSYTLVVEYVTPDRMSKRESRSIDLYWQFF